MKMLKFFSFCAFVIGFVSPLPLFAGPICQDFACEMKFLFLFYSYAALFICPFTFLLGFLLLRKNPHKTSGKVLMWLSGVILVTWAVFFLYRHIQRQQIDMHNEELVATAIPHLYIPDEKLLPQEASWRGRLQFNIYVDDYGEPGSLRPFTVEFYAVKHGTKELFLKDPVDLNYMELSYNKASELGTKCPNINVHAGKSYADSFTEECSVIGYFNGGIPIYESKPDPMYARIFSARINDTIVIVNAALGYMDHSALTPEQVISYFENLSVISTEDFITQFGSLGY